MTDIFKQKLNTALVEDEDFISLNEYLAEDRYASTFRFIDFENSSDGISIYKKPEKTASQIISFMEDNNVDLSNVDDDVKLINQFLLCMSIATNIWDLINNNELIVKGSEPVIFDSNYWKSKNIVSPYIIFVHGGNITNHDSNDLAVEICIATNPIGNKSIIKSADSKDIIIRFIAESINIEKSNYLKIILIQFWNATQKLEYKYYADTSNITKNIIVRGIENCIRY